MTESTALYDLPRPATRLRHPLHGVISTLAVLAPTGWILHLLLAGGQFTAQEATHAGRLIASHLDHDLPFSPAVMVISPICVGMCVLLSWIATRVARRERRSPETQAVDVAPAVPETLLPGGVPS